VALHLIDVAVGGNPATIREFAQTAEEIGYQDLSAPDHVLGVNVASRPDWGDGNISAGPAKYRPRDDPEGCVRRHTPERLTSVFPALLLQLAKPAVPIGTLHSHLVAALSSDR